MAKGVLARENIRPDSTMDFRAVALELSVSCISCLERTGRRNSRNMEFEHKGKRCVALKGKSAFLLLSSIRLQLTPPRSTTKTPEKRCKRNYVSA